MSCTLDCQLRSPPEHPCSCCTKWVPGRPALQNAAVAVMSKWRQHSEKLKKNPRTLSIPSCTYLHIKPKQAFGLRLCACSGDFVGLNADLGKLPEWISGCDWTRYYLQTTEAPAFLRSSKTFKPLSKRCWQSVGTLTLEESNQSFFGSILYAGYKAQVGRKNSASASLKPGAKEAATWIDQILRTMSEATCGRSDRTRGQGGKGTHQKNCPLGMSGSNLPRPQRFQWSDHGFQEEAPCSKRALSRDANLHARKQVYACKQRYIVCIVCVV